MFSYNLQFVLRNVLISKFLVSLFLFTEVTPRTRVPHRPVSLEQILSSANGAIRGNELSAFIQNSSALLPDYD